MSTRNWDNLKEMRCPSCGAPISDEKNHWFGYTCSDESCRFQISFEKFESVVRSLYQPSKAEIDETEERNRQWLNEL